MSPSARPRALGTALSPASGPVQPRSPPCRPRGGAPEPQGLPAPLGPAPRSSPILPAPRVREKERVGAGRTRKALREAPPSRGPRETVRAAPVPIWMESLKKTSAPPLSEPRYEFYLIYIKFKAILFMLLFPFQANKKTRRLWTTNPRNLCAKRSLRRRL